MNSRFSHTVLSFSFALLLCISCTKQEAQRDVVATEVSLSMDSPFTKGYVTDGTLFDTPYENLHGSAVSAPRTMTVSARLYPQSGEEADYLVGEEFSRGSDGMWHHDPAVYWPVGGELSFLALSSLHSLDDAVWCEWNCAKEVTVAVDTTFTQDDLLFSCLDRSSAAVATSMQFSHSQAWLQFRISAKSGHENEYVFRGVTLKTIYRTGELTVSEDDGEPKMIWSFRRSVRRTVPMDDVHGAGGSLVKADTLYMDMLIPEQEKTGYVIRYSTSASPSSVTERTVALPHENWLAGRKYIYDLSFGN